MKNNIKKSIVIFDIGGVLFSYKNARDVYFAIDNPGNNPFTPIESGLNILQKCFDKKNDSGQKANKLFVLSNWNIGPFNLLKKQFPEPFKLFDGIVISGQIGLRKPDKRFYEYFIKTHNINPIESIFIDDQIENVQAAEELGITGIFCYDHIEVEKKLHSLGIF